MRGKRRSRQLALVLALAILLSLFVAVIGLLLAMSACSPVLGTDGPPGPGPLSTAFPNADPEADPTPPLSSQELLTSPETKAARPTTNFRPTEILLESKPAPTTTTTTTTTTTPPRTTAVKTTARPVQPKTPGAVAITFDDGPGAHTARLLDALKEYGVKVTFFVQGQFVEKSPGLITRMHQEGHQVANHTYSHAYLSKVDEATRRSQLIRTSDAIEKVIGIRPTIMRPPGGFRSQAVYEEAGRQGMATVFWDIDTADWKYKDKNYLYNFLLNRTSKGKIVLMHDIHKTTVDEFIRALPVLIERGFTFVTVDELVSLAPGDVYPSYWGR